MKRLLRTAWAVATGLAAMAAVRAQDVTVSPLAWVEPDGAPQELPSRKRRLEVEFPADLRKTPDVGWAWVEVWLDAKGKVRIQHVVATQPHYEHATRSSNAAHASFKPARRDGQPVASHVKLVVVFNPASANAKGANSQPRLLDAGPVVDPQWSAKRHWSDEQRVVWAEVSLDERGEVVALEVGDAAEGALLKEAVRTWKFAPARKEGQPVAATLRVPFVVVPTAPEDPTPDERPKPIDRPLPEYPKEMRYLGLRGEVLVNFIIDREGFVQRASVARTLNPGFNEAALAAVRKWRFEPARVKGRAVAVSMQQPITFELDGERDGGNDGMLVKKRGDVSKLPPELRFDVEPKTRVFVAPRYPKELLAAKTEGSATVGLLIGEEGKVIGTRVIQADRPEFGLALQAAADRFEYYPALKDGRPTKALLAFTQKFETDNTMIASEEERRVLRLETKHPEQVLSAAALDRPLHPLMRTPPVYPKSNTLAHVDRGQAEVEFLVDTAGDARLPRVISASDPAFGYAAAHAVSEWKFDPPMSHGKPAVVRVRIEFEFKRPGGQPDAAPVAK